MEGLSLSSADLQQPKELLLRRLVTRPEGAESVRALLAARFKDNLQWFKDTISPAPAGLETSLKKTEQNALFLAEKLVDRYETLLGEQDQQLSGKLSRLQSQLFPDGAPQERSVSIMMLAAKYGMKAIKKALYVGFAPFCMNLQDIRISD